MDILTESDPEKLALLYVQQWLHEQGYSSGESFNSLSYLVTSVPLKNPQMYTGKSSLVFLSVVTGLNSEVLKLYWYWYANSIISCIMCMFFSSRGT